MKLHVTGVETIEITDPQGVSNQPQPNQPSPMEKFGDMYQWPPRLPAPQIPTPFSPRPTSINPWGDRPIAPSIYKHEDDPKERWQRSFTGDPPAAVFRTADGDKWAMGMNAALRAPEEDTGIGNGNKSYQG
ncbi:hypothetical protein ES703_17724 [subsurface metagenome]